MSIQDGRSYRSARMVYKEIIYVQVENPSPDANPMQEHWYWKTGEYSYRPARDTKVVPGITYYRRDGDGIVHDHKAIYYNNTFGGRYPVTINAPHYGIYVPDENILYDLDPEKDDADHRPNLAWQAGFDDEYIIIPGSYGNDHGTAKRDARTIIAYPQLYLEDSEEVQGSRVFRMFGRSGTHSATYRSAHTPYAIGQYFKARNNEFTFVDIDPNAQFKDTERKYDEIDEEEIEPSDDPMSFEWYEKKMVHVQGIKEEDDPKEKGWYEIIEGTDPIQYQLTEDTSPIPDKEYFEESDDYQLTKDRTPYPEKKYYEWNGEYKYSYPYTKIKAVSSDGRLLYSPNEMPETDARVMITENAGSGMDQFTYGPKNITCKDGFVYESAVNTAGHYTFGKHKDPQTDEYVDTEWTYYKRTVSFQKVESDGSFGGSVSLFDVLDNGVDIEHWNFSEDEYNDYCVDSVNSNVIYALHAVYGSYVDPYEPYGIYVYLGFKQLIIDEYTIITKPVEDVQPNDNPKSSKWYEFDGTDYILSKDETVISGKTYYQYDKEKTNSWKKDFRIIAKHSCITCNLVHTPNGAYLFAFLKQDGVEQGPMAYKCSYGFSLPFRLSLPNIPIVEGQRADLIYFRTYGHTWNFWYRSEAYYGDYYDRISNNNGLSWSDRIPPSSSRNTIPFEYINEQGHHITTYMYPNPVFPIQSMHYKNRQLVDAGNEDLYVYRCGDYFVIIDNEFFNDCTSKFRIYDPVIGTYAHSLKWKSDPEIMDYYVDKEGE